MKRFLFHFHRQAVVAAVRFCEEHCGEQAVLVALAFLIGLAGAVAAEALHGGVEALGACARRLEETAGASLPGWSLAAAVAFVLLPLLGIVLSGTVQRLWGGPRYAKSLSPLILALYRRSTAIPLRETVTHILSSALAVGLGGSAGLEAPSVLTGAAIGANCGSFLGVSHRRRSLLIGCGAAAAISAIFGSPIGGVLFAVEVLLPEFRVGALIPMLISSAVATVAGRFFGGGRTLALEIGASWRTDAVPFYFLYGALAAVIGVYVIRVAYRLGELLRRSFPRLRVRMLVGGLALALLLALFPPLRGQGYDFIRILFAGDLAALAASAPLLAPLGSPVAAVVLLLGAGILLKVVTSVLTVESGGDGGIFAPSMFIGAFAGFAFARLVNLTGIAALQESNFVIVGMCGVFTAVMRAPLTGIFLIAEVTGGYVLLVPLMIVSAVSWFVARRLEPESIYRKVLVEGHLLYDDRDKAVLQRLPVRLNVERNYPELRAEEPLSRLNELVEERPCEVFPVLDGDRRLVGVLHLDRVMAALVNPELESTLLVFDLMESPRVVLSPEDDLARAMEDFDLCRVEFLPVNDGDGRFIGFVSRKACFGKYRRLVREADSF